MNNRFRLLEIFFVLLFLYLILLQIEAIWSFTIDDTYISLRYAKHWAEGAGLLWNLNEPPVEGYTNFSFVVLGAFALLLHQNPVIVLKITGLIGLFFTCFFIYLITRFWFGKRESFLPCIAILLYKGEIIWAMSGLETAFYQALICGAVYFAFHGLGYQFYPDLREGARPASPDRKELRSVSSVSLMLSGIFLAIAGLTRPEAPALMALFFILIYWDSPKSTRTEWIKGLLFFVLPLLLIYGPYFLWRWNYFGFLFPNSVYCKGYGLGGFKLDIYYIKLAWPFMFFALCACLKAKDKRCLFLLLPSFIYLLLLIGADPIVAFDNRLFLTAFVLLLPLTLLGIRIVLLGYFKSKEKDLGYLYSFYLLCLCMAVLFLPALIPSAYRDFAQNPIAGEGLRSNVVVWLQANMKAGDHVVISDAGLIPYYSNLNFIDSYCLNNAVMSQYAKKEMYQQFCKHIMLEKPEAIIMTSLVDQGRIKYTPADKCLNLMLKQQKEYKLKAPFSARSYDSIYRYELFVKL